MAEPGDDGWFGPGSTIWAVHADAATLVGGVRALLVQAMHPTVLAGFDQHSDYREDPESRLQRTAAFVTVTTFGTSAQAEPTPASGYAGRTPRSAAAPRRASRTTPATPSCSAGCTSRWPTRSPCRSAATGRTALRPGRLPRRHGGRRGAARRRPRPARRGPGWPRPGPTTCRSWRVTRADRRGARASCSTRRCRRRIRGPYRVVAAAAAATLPPDLRPLLAGRPLLPDLPARVVGRAATRLLAVVLGQSPAAAAAHRRTTPAARP